MDISKESIDVLRDRYGYCRTEIMYRLEVRYKLVQILLATITFGLFAVFRLEWGFIPLIIVGLLFAICILLLGESMHIRILSDYLIKIERILDKNLDYSIVGWERESRSRSGDKVTVSALLAIGALIFIIIIYSLFSWQASVWLSENLGTFCTLLSGSCQTNYFLFFLFTFLVFVGISLGTLLSSWKKTKR